MGLFTLLCGIAAPLAVTGIPQVAFPLAADGSLVERDEGRRLVSDRPVLRVRALIPSPSVGRHRARFRDSSQTVNAPCNAAISGASLRGPTNAALLDSIKERVVANGPALVLGDAATTSGSGLDPHISPANAAGQVERVAGASAMPAERMRALVAGWIELPALGFLGEPRVNVPLLNLALDALR